MPAAADVDDEELDEEDDAVAATARLAASSTIEATAKFLGRLATSPPVTLVARAHVGHAIAKLRAGLRTQPLKHCAQKWWPHSRMRGARVEASKRSQHTLHSSTSAETVSASSALRLRALDDIFLCRCDHSCHDGVIADVSTSTFLKTDTDRPIALC